MSRLPGFSQPHPIRTETQYEAAVAEIERLLNIEPPLASDAFCRLELLSVLTEAYEEKAYPMPFDEVTPAALVEFMLEQKGLDRTALYEMMGGEGQVSEFISGERDLSPRQIEALQDLLGIPEDLLQ